VIPAQPVRRALFGVALAAALSMTGACGGGGASGGRTGLDGALAGVAGTGASRAYFEWADVARIRELGGITQQQPAGTGDADHHRWSSLFGTGTGSLGTAALQLAGTIDLFTARTAVQIGQPPATAVRIDGVDTGEARAGLVGFGGRPGKVAGHDGVILGADNSIDISNQLAQLGQLNTFNKTAFDGDRVAFGPAEQPVADILGAGGHALGGDTAVADAAGCLGDVITADITPAGSAGVGNGVLTLGIGVRAPARGSDAAIEELCLITAGKGAGDQLEQQVRQHATLSAVSQASGQPWSAQVSSIAVSRAGDRAVRVELTDRADHPAGLLVRALARMDLTGLTG
jgi:hypothetical protein